MVCLPKWKIYFIIFHVYLLLMQMTRIFLYQRNMTLGIREFSMIFPVLQQWKSSEMRNLSVGQLVKVVSQWVSHSDRPSVTVRPAGRQAVLGGRQAGRSWVCIALASSDNQMRVVLSSVLRSCAEALWQPSPSCPISFLPFVLLHLVPFPLLVSFLQLGKWSLSVLFNTIFLFSL